MSPDSAVNSTHDQQTDEQADRIIIIHQSAFKINYQGDRGTVKIVGVTMMSDR